MCRTWRRRCPVEWQLSSSESVSFGGYEPLRNFLVQNCVGFYGDVVSVLRFASDMIRRIVCCCSAVYELILTLSCLSTAV
jgi:hypothetical protein